MLSVTTFKFTAAWSTTAIGKWNTFVGASLEFDTATRSAFSCADSAVSSANDTVTISGFNWVPGTKVVYTCSGAGVITGLTSGSTYYVLPGSALGNFRLSSTYNGATINITAPVGGDTHTFTRTGISAEVVPGEVTTVYVPYLGLNSPSGSTTEGFTDFADGVTLYRFTSTAPVLTYSTWAV